MADNKDRTKTVVKLCAAGVTLIILGYAVIWFIFMPTVGGSFGAGFPSGSGGSRVKSVIIDVDPQVVYRIDENRFFTLEQYKDCTHGGFVYYHDTKRGIKQIVPESDGNKSHQDELDLSLENDVMAFKGRFILSAGNGFFAYPYRDRNYKYGGANYYAIYRGVDAPAKGFRAAIYKDTYEVNVSEGMIYVATSSDDESYKVYNTPGNPNKNEDIDMSKVDLKRVSQDSVFHCDNSIKPRSIKYK